jgi:hypothetical protein
MARYTISGMTDEMVDVDLPYEGYIGTEVNEYGQACFMAEVEAFSENAARHIVGTFVPDAVVVAVDEDEEWGGGAEDGYEQNAGALRKAGL